MKLVALALCVLSLTAGPARADILSDLEAVPGMKVAEVASEDPTFRMFRLSFSQPINHDEPLGDWFDQQMVLLHRDDAAPMVFHTEGYELYGEQAMELTYYLGANQLSVEHRYFGGSIPPDNYAHLSIQQAAADHHRVVEALHGLYPAAWVSTGQSKGGMTAAYHHRFYPDDLAGTVAYVAPLSTSPNDKRYNAFLNQVGSAKCRKAIADFQREVLLRRDELKPLFEEWFGAMGFTRIKGGIDTAIDSAAVEFEFGFWQYDSPTSCDSIPAAGAPIEQVGNAIALSMFFGTDVGIEVFYPYYLQAAHQLGYPGVKTDHLADLLQSDPSDLSIWVSEEHMPAAFDYAAMADMSAWSAFVAQHIIFIYGELDPWTAGAFPVLPIGDRDAHVFIAPGENHGAGIWALPDAEQLEVIGVLENWIGQPILLNGTPLVPILNGINDPPIAGLRRPR